MMRLAVRDARAKILTWEVFDSEVLVGHVAYVPDSNCLRTVDLRLDVVEFDLDQGDSNFDNALESVAKTLLEVTY